MVAVQTLRNVGRNSARAALETEIYAFSWATSIYWLR